MKIYPNIEKPLTARQKLGVFFARIFNAGKKAPANADFLKMKAKGELIPAFEVDGRTYYQYANEEKIPPLRAFAALDYYDAIERKVSPDYLEAYCKAVLELCNTKDYAKIAILTHFLHQRTQDLTNIELIYNLGAVLYMDETEDPNNFDYAFAFEKVQLWKREAVSRFFLRTPLKNYLPFSGSLDTNLQTFTAAQKEKQITQLTALIPILSKNEDNRELLIRLQQQIAALQKQTNC